MGGEDFREVSLDEIAEFRNGKAISPAQCSEFGKHPVFGSNGQIARSDAVLYGEPVIAIGRVGAYCGSVHYIPEPSWVTDNAIAALSKPNNSLRFLYYLFTHLDLRRTAIGSAQPLMTQGGIKAVRTIVPAPKTQRAIACILGSLDDKIELNRRMNRTLEEMARAIFKSWFIDFDPVRAKAAVRREHPKWTDDQVSRAACPKLKPEIARLFPDSFENSELGEIPRGWAISTVDEAFELTMGQSPPGETYNETGDGLPFYQGRADFGFRFPKRRVFCTAPTRLAKRGDTLVSVRAPVGDINMASEDCAIGRGVGSIRHKSGSRSFTYYSMRALESQFEVFEAEGTVFGSISKKDFHRLAVVVPPKNLVAQFERLSCPFDDAIECNEQESGTLAALRDALLPKLISGELPIADAERVAARCA